MPSPLPRAVAASAVALAVAGGPLAVGAHADRGDGQVPNPQGSWASADGGKNPGGPGGPGGAGDPKDPKDPQGGKDPGAPGGPTPVQGPKPPPQGPDDQYDGAYTGEVISTSLDASSKPTAPPVTAYEMPFPCGEVWTGSTRSSHSPSVRSVDFNRPDDLGDPVVAAADGVVTTAVTGKKRPSYGQFVVIDHGNDESTLYAHLDSVTAVVGQAVTAGTQIGTVGNTGNSSGAHLHFEQRRGSAVIDAWFGGVKFPYSSAQESRNCDRVSVPDVPLAGNLVGNKRADLAVWRRSGTPAFHVRREPKADKVITYGSATDQPLLGDWDGNGKANPGVRRGKEFLLKVGRRVTELKFGGKADIGIVGDWDGDGRWDVGTRRPTSNLFRLRAADGTVTKVRLGDVDDLPVTGDWDGDGLTDLGVYDSATATFTLRRVDGTGMEWLSQAGLGVPGDLPVTGDWDANGFTDLGVWNPDTATFTKLESPTPTTQGRKHRKVQRVRFGIGR